VSISRSDSELTFALFLSPSEKNLQSMIRPSSHARGLSASPRTASVRRVVKLKVGVKGASRRAVKAPPHSRKIVICLFLCKILSFAAAAAAAFALAGYSSGQAVRGSLHMTPRAALRGHPHPRARGSDPSMVLGFALGRSLAGIGVWGSTAMETSGSPALLEQSALSVQTELLRGMKGPSPPPAGAIEFKWPAARLSTGKPPSSSAARRAAGVGTGALADLIEQDMAPPNATPFQVLQRLRTQLSPLSMPPECADVGGPPEPPVALAGIIGAALLVIASTDKRASPTTLAVAGSQASLTAGVAVDFDMAPALPAGFDIDAATVCASLCGAAYTMNGSRVDYPLLRTRLRDVGLEYSDAIEIGDHFVYIARRGNEVFLTFRGSCNGQNVRTDLDYNSCAESLAAFERESGLRMPDGIKLHRGFLEAWRLLREPIIRKIEALMVPAGQAPGMPAQAGGPGGRLKLYVTGHSMGGAIGQLASWELAHRFRKASTRTRYGIHRTYTFAAPRVGNCAFARHFVQTFPRPADHWALQAAADAVCHLPFAAWGFQHPEGVLKLGCPSHPAQRSGDVGDHAHFLRPKDGKLINWVITHDMETYVNHLADLACTAGLASHCDAARMSHFAP
jgi:hypothetical protein